ncbi:LamG-like jellyroll fold domain-containing protein [Akkermansia sp. N21116]|uniref:LamG-like jellyroll fold domain-containing protein n=1 Tax=Akkermansia sp. N21116 TaxID=3040764 RepID=UPI00244ED613|nr:LamG-like jellyroll fold domain-containing protein [Akkermansia sp. N21116]WPX39702.1 LamG-like jellyroll fold domain-containing protein [Akkermansia sp. N21116]
MIDLAKRFFIIFILLFAIAISDAAVTVYSWKYTPDGAQINAPGWLSAFKYTKGDEFAILGFGNTPFKGEMTEFPAGFTVSFDIKSLSNINIQGQTLLSLYLNHDDNNYPLELKFNEKGKLYLYNRLYGAVSFGGEETGNAKFIDTGLTCKTLRANKWTNICIVSNLSAHTLSVYVNKSLIASITDWNPKHPALTGAQFGKSFGNTPSLNGTIEINNVNFYNDAVPPGSSLFSNMPHISEFSKMFNSRARNLKNKYIVALKKLQQKYIKKQDFASVSLILDILKDPDSPVAEEQLPQEILNLATAYKIHKDQMGEQIKQAYLKTLLQQQVQYAQKQQFNKLIEIREIIRTVEQKSPSELFMIMNNE